MTLKFVCKYNSLPVGKIIPQGERQSIGISSISYPAISPFVSNGGSQVTIAVVVVMEVFTTLTLVGGPGSAHYTQNIFNTR